MIWNNTTKTIAHIDADAFFATCEQALHPEYKGKPIVIGQERGIAVAVSYEAKAKGVVRGMTMREIKQVCPEAIIVSSDHESYSLFSKRMFAIMRRYSDAVEEYGIDEGFMDLSGMRRPLGMSYGKMAYEIKQEIEQELGISVSIGLGPSKVLAKAASKWNKPSGFCHITTNRISDYLKKLPIQEVWGIGKNTAAYMHQLGIFTAYQFANKSIGFIETHFTKPHQAIWRELQGDAIFAIKAEEKQTYASISKSRTFVPTTQKAYIFSELIKNIENACIKARRYKLASRKMVIMLKTQSFDIKAVDVCLSRATAYPSEMVQVAKYLFDQIYEEGVEYRTTGVTLGDLGADTAIQTNLFEAPITLTKMKNIYASVDALSQKFGKHTVHLGASTIAHTKETLHTHVTGSAKKRFAIPVLS